MAAGQRSCKCACRTAPATDARLSLTAGGAGGNASGGSSSGGGKPQPDRWVPPEITVIVNGGDGGAGGGLAGLPALVLAPWLPAAAQMQKATCVDHSRTSCGCRCRRRWRLSKRLRRTGRRRRPGRPGAVQSWCCLCCQCTCQSLCRRPGLDVACVPAGGQRRQRHRLHWIQVLHRPGGPPTCASLTMQPPPPAWPCGLLSSCS